MNRTFWILYLTNLVIIFVGLLTPIFKLVIASSSSDVLLTGYYAVLIFLSVTFCISFFGLNIYGALKQRTHRLRYYTVATFLFAWIAWGAYQIVYAYMHDISL